MRDFIHIDDCVRGVITTIDKINDSSAINLCTGKLTSFYSFIIFYSSYYGPKYREFSIVLLPQPEFPSARIIFLPLKGSSILKAYLRVFT